MYEVGFRQRIETISNEIIMKIRLLRKSKEKFGLFPLSDLHIPAWSFIRPVLQWKKPIAPVGRNCFDTEVIDVSTLIFLFPNYDSSVKMTK